MAEQKAAIMDADGVRRALTRIAFEIIEKNKGTENLLLAGVKTRGVFLAERIAQKLGEVEGSAPPVIALDVTPWRDDKPRTDTPLPPADPRIKNSQRPVGGKSTEKAERGKNQYTRHSLEKEQRKEKQKTAPAPARARQLFPGTANIADDH